jgi:transketolase
VLEVRRTVGIIACGEMVAKSLMCVQELERKGVEVGILNLHTIKPMDEEGVRDFVLKYKNILTVEEHQVAGGMGSAVLEMLTQTENSAEKKEIFNNLNLKIMGVQNRFGQSGNREELLEEYGLNEKHILSNVLSLLD